jgi:diguanylate cyclase (GGDEF)-like protein
MSRGARQAAASTDAESASADGSAWRPARWAIWAIPRRLLGPVLFVELTAIALTALSVSPSQFDRRSILLSVFLCAIGIAHSEIALRVERIRRRVTETLHVDLSSVWTFAGAVLLPPALAAGVATVVFTHLWWRSWRPRVPVYRHVFSTATIILACLAAGGVTGVDHAGDVAALPSDLSGVLLLAVAILTYTTVNSALVAGAVAVSSAQPDIGKVLGRWDDNLLEFATLSLGAITAVALSINPLLVVLVLPPLLVLHRAVLVRHLEDAANTDGKTGLLNAAAWHVKAERALQRRRRGDGPRGVLVLDLDHFKAVNDTHGHIAGDHVLAAVADVLRSEVGERDLIGRFGGEEFVVMLAGLAGSGTAELEAVAERIRRRVADLRVEIPTPDGPLTVMGLSVSVGCAVSPDTDAAELRDLLQAADKALYAAKGAGRNAVRMGTALLSRPPLLSLPEGSPAEGSLPEGSSTAGLRQDGWD